MTNKYIDAEKLIAEIDYRLHCNGAFDEVGDYQWHYDQGMVDAYKYIREVVTSLQQEQPEVDLKMVVRIDNIIMNMLGEGYNSGYKTRPFYEEVLRRLNARKEE